MQLSTTGILVLIGIAAGIAIFAWALRSRAKQDEQAPTASHDADLVDQTCELNYRPERPAGD